MIIYTNEVTGSVISMTDEELFERIIQRHPAKRSIRLIQQRLDQLYAAESQSAHEDDPSDESRVLLAESLDLDEQYWAFVNDLRCIFFPSETDPVAPIWKDEID
ncbi:hypothetical protein [Halothiobacillus diazotrophicus]|uniref:hypothetical protein n=1 Tax=Halothiobacillus diazotrophicus TaxID=1860122 RepID=UPI0012E94B49|nr:hypothetical protein [Halothiobacillus diazotrophicus]